MDVPSGANTSYSVAMMRRVIPLIGSIAIATAGCSSSDGTPQSDAPPSLTGSFSSICSYLDRTDALKRAVDVAGQGDSASDGDVAAVKADLGAVYDVAPDVMRLALKNVIDQVGTASAPQVVPDTNLIAGECRARGLTIPNVK